MRLDQLGADAAERAHHLVAGVDVDHAIARVEHRHHRRQRMQRGGAVLAAVAAVVALVVVPGWLSEPDHTVTAPPAFRPQMTPSVELVIPDGFRVLRESDWHVDIGPVDVSEEQPWAQLTLLAPDGVYDRATGTVQPLPDDLESWVQAVPEVELLGTRTVTVMGQDAFQYDDHPTSFQDQPYWAVDGEPLPGGGTAIFHFRTTVFEVSGEVVTLSGAVQQRFWPLPAPGTPGDPYDALLASLRSR